MTIFFAIIAGLMAGSFLNVCIYRMPRQKSVIIPGSHCPHCNHAIPWYDNIPVLSFVILGGRCRFCKKRISIRYTIVELLTASVFSLLINQLGLHITTIISMLLACGMIISTFVDFEYQIIPDEITYGGMVLGLLLSFIFPQLHNTANRLHAAGSSLIGLLVGGIIIWLIGEIGRLIFKKEAMGGGDVKFLAMIGSFVGYKDVILIFFLAPFFGAFVGIVMKIRHKVDIIPYGPYLSLASLVVIIWGEKILRKIFPGI